MSKRLEGVMEVLPRKLALELDVPFMFKVFQGQAIEILSLPHPVGEAGALAVGLASAGGDIVLTLPAEAQVEPADLPRLVEIVGDLLAKPDPHGLRRVLNAHTGHLESGDGPAATAFYCAQFGWEKGCIDAQGMPGAEGQRKVVARGGNLKHSGRADR